VNFEFRYNGRTSCREFIFRDRSEHRYGEKIHQGWSSVLQICIYFMRIRIQLLRWIRIQLWKWMRIQVIRYKQNYEVSQISRLKNKLFAKYEVKYRSLAKFRFPSFCPPPSLFAFGYTNTVEQLRYHWLIDASDFLSRNYAGIFCCVKLYEGCWNPSFFVI
jgi:hypothetical protein